MFIKTSLLFTIVWLPLLCLSQPRDSYPSIKSCDTIGNSFSENKLQLITHSQSIILPEQFIIPVIIHVFHDGDDGRLDRNQIMSGLEIINNDFNGRNDGWNAIDPAFDSIKGTLSIKFTLASLDTAGIPTSGIIYYDDVKTMNNQTNLFQYGWDNFKYLNIFLPKYAYGGPSELTGYGMFPNLSNTENNKDGIIISSYRWGFGDNSELEQGDDWASIITHEAGHWLNLYHTFQGGCSGSGDYVNDTPPTEGGKIQLEGCNNYDFSCGVHTNGENFMNYNQRCKKMFTKGQVERMIAALNLESRQNLWSDKNLKETGSVEPYRIVLESNTINFANLYPNPVSNKLYIDMNLPSTFTLYSINGSKLMEISLEGGLSTVDVSKIPRGICFYSLKFNTQQIQGKFIISR